MDGRSVALTLKPKRESKLKEATTYLRKTPAVVVASVTLLFIFAAVILAPVVAPLDPNDVRPDDRLLPVGSPGYPLGTDPYGRDILSRLIWGGRISLVAGIVPAFAAMAIGLCLGLVSGYVGGAFDNIVMRVIDVIMAFPFMLLAITVVAALGPSLLNAMIAVVIAVFPRDTRLIRGLVLSLKEQEFVEAARALGYSPLRIIFSEIAPGVMSTVIVIMTLHITTMIAATAGLSFLGLGVQLPKADWGKMVADGRQFVIFAPHIVLVPSIVLSIVCLCFSILGDALQTALHPSSDVATGS